VVLEKVIGDAENHALVLVNGRFESRAPIRFGNGLCDARLLSQATGHYYPSYSEYAQGAGGNAEIRPLYETRTKQRVLRAFKNGGR